jgi:hypothetical protein
MTTRTRSSRVERIIRSAKVSAYYGIVSDGLPRAAAALTMTDEEGGQAAFVLSHSFA